MTHNALAALAGLANWYLVGAIALAIFSMMLGFQSSRRQRLMDECWRSWHVWQDDGDGLYCGRCGTRPILEV